MNVRHDTGDVPPPWEGAPSPPDELDPGEVFERADHVEMGERLVADLTARAETVTSENAWWAYDSKRGVFVEIPRDHLSCHVQGFAGSPVRGEKKPLSISAGAVKGTLELGAAQIASPEFFAEAPAGIAFSDCFLRVSEAGGLTTVAHGPANRARHAYPFPWNADASPPTFGATLHQMFRDDMDAPEKAQCIREFLGLSILGLGTLFQKCLVLSGDGANGKGVISHALISCAPPGTASSVPPQDLENEYNRAILAGKRLNIVSELPEADIIDSEAWKAVIAGDMIKGREIYQKPFFFRPIAGHVYSANRLPGTADQSHGFWRRLVVVEFGRIFAESEQDSGLTKKIQAEVPSIVPWAIAGAVEALQRKGLTIPSSAEAAKEKWRRDADQVLAWMEECAVATEPLELGSKASDLYRSYHSWAPLNGHRAMAINKFSGRLSALGYKPTHTRDGNRYPLTLRSSSYSAAHQDSAWGIS